MSEPLQLTTELEAVNTILGAVGESPVVDLSSDFVDAELARNMLRTEMRTCQTKGWTFNTLLEVVFEPNDDGEIIVPPNTLLFVYTDPNIVMRGTRLFDRTLRSYTFTEAITATSITEFLPFEEMPQAMRDYCTIAAARKFQDQYQGDATIHKFKERDELRAWADLLNAEAATAGWNMIGQNTLAQRMKQGRP